MVSRPTSSLSQPHWKTATVAPRETPTGLRAEITALLAEGQAAGSVRSDISLTDAASLVLAAADGLSTQWLLDGSADLKSGLLLLQRLLEPPDRQVGRTEG
ncbi:hypothetical protein AWW66_05130 [Micromonospora rosaria]|uniref:BetI-type transcriptional repressor C-terminal domain-containing protein n=1 Tax=Micromonospora rosaria TaxID=47874 RepID=A0A136PX03_9ACTN|nr:hypothetical protein AWW66_05130 [Micromonospora rosaria]